MKNIINYGAMRIQQMSFNLDKFIESDAPGTLSWLNMDSNDLNIEEMTSNETELSSGKSSCAVTRYDKQGIPCLQRCNKCRKLSLENEQ